MLVMIIDVIPIDYPRFPPNETLTSLRHNNNNHINNLYDNMIDYYT